MDPLAIWHRFRAVLPVYNPRWRFAARMTASGLAAYAVAEILHVPLNGLWVIITAIVVTQMSAGGSLRATLEYIIGTVGGAVYAAIIGVLIPQFCTHPSNLEGHASDVGGRHSQTLGNG
jgi:uncharacterized membrane protein YccC